MQFKHLKTPQIIDSTYVVNLREFVVWFSVARRDGAAGEWSEGGSGGVSVNDDHPFTTLHSANHPHHLRQADEPGPQGTLRHVGTPGR